jgi:hypothetical protein
MAREPAAPSTPGGGESAVGERFGPLAIERVAKADGRALILYSRAEPPGRAESLGRAEQAERSEREGREPR